MRKEKVHLSLEPDGAFRVQQKVEKRTEADNLQLNKSESSRSCIASFKNLGQKFGTKIWDKPTDRQTDRVIYSVALQLKKTQFQQIVS